MPKIVINNFQRFHLTATFLIIFILFGGGNSEESEEFFDDNCYSDQRCRWQVPNSVCLHRKCQCLNDKNVIVIQGKPFCPLVTGVDMVKNERSIDYSALLGANNNETIQPEIKSNYLQKLPGEFCQSSEQCLAVGNVEYRCISSICQVPPDCRPGYIGINAECLPYSVIGGHCSYPIQCLAGSICIHGKCRGPCEKNQLLIDDQCIDYEGAGCVAIGCMAKKCPRSFPECNYIQQRQNYLCCERPLRNINAINCPNPGSVPQINPRTNEVVTCIEKGDKQCESGFSCQFSSYDHGSYICCSIKN